MKKFLSIHHSGRALGLFIFIFLFLFTVLLSRPTLIVYTGQSASTVFASGNIPAPTAPTIEFPAASSVEEEAPKAVPATPPKVKTPPANPLAHAPEPIALPAPAPISIPAPAPVPVPATSPSFGYQYPIPPGFEGIGGGSSTPPPPVVVPPPAPDTTAPVFAAVSTITAEATTSLGAYVSYASPTATDAVSGPAAVTCTPLSVALFALGTTTVQCDATDTAGNAASTTFNVVVSDTVAPTIPAAASISVQATSTASVAAVVTYTSPLANDAVSGSVAVACTPASGSLFGVSTTTVACSATDTAGNTSTSNFDVGVYLPPTPPGPVTYVMASQPNASFLCTPLWDSPDWDDCSTGRSGPLADLAIIPLGLSSGLGGGTIQSVTIAKDENSLFSTAAYPWIISIKCFTDAAYTQHCSDWVTGPALYVQAGFSVSEPASIATSTKYWTANFNDSSHEHNADGSPLSFISNRYYQLVVDDNGYQIAAYGSKAISTIYWELIGLH